jgi:hypothetical protein
MQVALYLLDRATTAAVAASLRWAVNKLALQGDRPWATAAGASLTNALSRAHQELQEAALSCCPDTLIESAPAGLLCPALAARCVPWGEPPLLHLALPPCLLATPEACSRFAAAAGILTHVQSIRIDARLGEFTVDDGLAHLAAVTGLSHLDLRECEQVSDAGLEHLSRLTGLLHLDLSICRQVSDAGLAHLSGLTGLSHLDVSICK